MDSEMPHDRAPAHAQVLVICALDVEYDALQAALANSIQFPGTGDDWRELKHFFVRKGNLEILVVQLPTPSAGNVTSSALTANLLPLVNPALVVSFGIAGTLKVREVPARSVVYSQAVYYIDLRKDAADGGEDVKQMPSIPTHAELLKKLDALKRERAKKVILVSSESVVKSQDSHRREIATHSVADASVIEMEAFGVMQACEIEKSLYGTRRFCVAIKGISDNADLTKTDELHRPAARAAAAFLTRVLASPDIAELFIRSTAYTNAPPFRRFRVSDQVDERVETFLSLAEPALGADVDKATLVAAHLRRSKPRVFYHWRLTGFGLHFVDLRFVWILRALAEAGYPVECLLTDTPNELTFNKLRSQSDYRIARNAVENIMRGLFAGLPYRMTLYSEVRQQERVLSAFADPSGGQQALHDALIAASSGRAQHFEQPQVMTEFNLWFRYIAWRCRFDGTCIVLINPNHRETYAQLWRFGELVPAIIPTCDVRMGGVPAKTMSPGTDLYLLPPGHGAITAWLERTDDRVQLDEFRRHLATISGNDGSVTDLRNDASVLKEVVPGDPAWLRAFLAQSDEEIGYHRGAVAVELARWTRRMTGGHSLQSAEEG